MLEVDDQKITESKKGNKLYIYKGRTQMIQLIFLTIFQKVSHFFQIHLGQEMQKKQFVSQDLQEKLDVEILLRLK